MDQWIRDIETLLITYYWLFPLRIHTWFRGAGHWDMHCWLDTSTEQRRTHTVWSLHPALLLPPLHSPLLHALDACSISGGILGVQLHHACLILSMDWWSHWHLRTAVSIDTVWHIPNTLWSIQSWGYCSHLHTACLPGLGGHHASHLLLHLQLGRWHGRVCCILRGPSSGALRFQMMNGYRVAFLWTTKNQKMRQNQRIQT